MKTRNEKINFPMKKQKKLSDEDMDYPSLMGFATLQVDNSEIIMYALKLLSPFGLGRVLQEFIDGNNCLGKCIFSVLEGGLGLFRECLWLTMKVVAKLNNTSTDHVTIF